MVRPVEPDPPDALRRIDQRVKRTDATPNKFDEHRVDERDRRDKGQGGHRQRYPLAPDQVTLEGVPAEESESPSPADRPTESPPPPGIDVEG